MFSPSSLANWCLEFTAQLLLLYSSICSLLCSATPIKLYMWVQGFFYYLYRYNVSSVFSVIFFSLWEILQSLYFAAFALIDVKHFELQEDHIFTEFIGKLMFGVYSAITIIVLINMLIAMLSNSYQIIAVSKFSLSLVRFVVMESSIMCTFNFWFLCGILFQLLNVLGYLTVLVCSFPFVKTIFLVTINQLIRIYSGAGGSGRISNWILASHQIFGEFNTFISEY